LAASAGGVLATVPFQLFVLWDAVAILAFDLLTLYAGRFLLLAASYSLLAVDLYRLICDQPSNRVFRAETARVLSCWEVSDQDAVGTKKELAGRTGKSRLRRRAAFSIARLPYAGHASV
jgi:hypothetical protein